MLVSWNWLKDYVDLTVSHEEFAQRVMLAGLNHEETVAAGNDWVIDLEVTSNRPDCLGHLGIAREAAVLFGHPLKVPTLAEPSNSQQVTSFAKVEIQAPELCTRYTARVIRGVKVAPSPKWLVERLQAIGIASVNNVVDVTNYVLMECGQPLHAFDLNRLHGQQLVIRQAKAGEKFTAINHKEYELSSSTCVIADADRPVAIAGIMGGADTEVSETTTDILLESAAFQPSSVRKTARLFNLHSPSSYRFERGVDPQAIDWASRRACSLIVELAGGELVEGSIDLGPQPPEQREPITLRIPQIQRILGIAVPTDRAAEILSALGNQVQNVSEEAITVCPPFWRSDLTREIDLIEEVARIYGYEAIPEDVTVPMATSARTRQDRVLTRVRHILSAAGVDEALTLSVVSEEWSQAFSPWTELPALISSMPVMRGADRLRRSLVPSLLGVRKTNQSLSNARIELFEIAKIYLPRTGMLPDEVLMLGLTSGSDYLTVKGILETVLATLNPELTLEVQTCDHPLLDAQRSAKLLLGGTLVDGQLLEPLLLGYLGELSDQGRSAFDLKSGTTVLEIKLQPLVEHAQLIAQYQEPVLYPAVGRDLNLVVDEAVLWADIAKTVRQITGPLLESLEYRDTYRDAQRLGAGKKSYLLALSLRSKDGTLTNEQADALREQVVAACASQHGAQLRA